MDIKSSLSVQYYKELSSVFFYFKKYFLNNFFVFLNNFLGFL